MLLSCIIAPLRSLLKLHDDIGGVILELSVFEDADDAGMADEVDGQRFGEEALAHLGILRKLRVQDLDRGARTDALVHGLQDHAHAAGADGSHHAVAADAVTDCHHG